MKALLHLFCFVALCLLTACSDKEITAPPQAAFDSIPTAHVVTPMIQEASGIADSKNVPKSLWVEEDSGNPPQLYRVGYDGVVQKKVYLKGAVNRDWEDMVRSGTDLYIADIGDNNKAYAEYSLYKFPEPAAAVDTVFTFEKIRFQYPDGAHDAEAFLVDPGTKSIYIITKNDKPAAIYKIAFPYSTTEINTVSKVGELTFSGVVSAALSEDATEILVKTYTAVYQYKSNGQSVEAALKQTPATLPYRLEPQGEAVTFAADNSGFFTLSEKGFASSVNLYFYKRR